MTSCFTRAAASSPPGPSQVIGQLYKLSQKKFEQTQVRLLIKVLGVYPPGSLVRLDDDALALVLSTEPSMPLRPKVLPYLKGQRPEGVAMIDLREDARSIVATLRQEELDDAQRAFSVWVGGSVTISPSELSPEAGDNSLDKPE